MRRSKKVKEIRSKRSKGKYKRIGAFFIVLGLLMILICLTLLPLYLLGWAFKEPLFISPVNMTADSSNSFDLSQVLKDELQNSKIDYSELSYQNGVYKIILKNGSVVYFSPNKNIKEQIASLQLIVANLTIEGKSFSSLDFRYDKPIIKLNN